MGLAPFTPALMLAGSVTSQFYNSLFDDTFAGIHHLTFFDWAVLIPYFGILAVLSCYGMHRFEMIRGYLKHRREARTAAERKWEVLPRVTVQLPLYNERMVVERLIDETLKIDYPRELLQIQVLDDSTDETHPFTEALVARYAAAGHPIEYRHRTHRHGFKAGA
ncbi:MAG TPA: glycosyl transferase family 2, partial [Bryobacteraceae bacterium]|nr:glycosyl transferase family 2 [Bryobacteraceae bacterium]